MIIRGAPVEAGPSPVFQQTEMSSIVVPVGGTGSDSDLSDHDEVAMADDEGFGSLNSRRPAVKISDRSGQLSHEGNKGTKGRGFRQDNEDGRYSGQGARFEQVANEEDINTPAQRSVEGWVVMITGIHSEAQEDDVFDLFAEVGEIKQLVLGLDRRSGYAKGYALIEYATFDEANKAVQELDGETVLDQQVQVKFAFKKPQGGNRRRR